MKQAIPQQKGTNWKLLIVTLASLLLFLIAIFFLTLFKLNKQAVEDSKNSAMVVSKDISHTVEVYFRDANTLNRTISDNFIFYKNNNFPRLSVYSLLKGSIAENDNLLAIWTMWKPNAFDGQDATYAGDSIHDKRGSFAMAYYYDAGKIKYEINDTLDFYEDFYVIPVQTRKPLVLEPFYYQYHGNERQYFQTCLVNPIIENDSVLGVIGIDIDLEALQENYKHLRVYKTGFVCILSNQGQIVTYPDSVDLDLKIKGHQILSDQTTLDSIRAGNAFRKQGISEFSGRRAIQFFYPIKLGYMAAPWYIMVEIPEDEIFILTKNIRNISLGILTLFVIIVMILVKYLSERKRAEEELTLYRLHLEKLVAERTHQLEEANTGLQSANEELESTLQNLKEAQAQLIQSEKMASLGVLTSGVAHEINNPLNYIMGGYVGLENYFRNTQKTDDPDVPLLLNGIKTGIDRASEIVKALGQYSRGNISTNEGCHIHSIMDSCLLMLHNQYKNRIEVFKYYSPLPITIYGNIGKWHQVFINLLTNSIHAIENVGKITITTKITNSGFIIEIADTGCGISKDNLTKITDPFFTTKEPGKGTGLGLSIAYTIINEHNGKLEFESELGKGTTARIVLPKN